MAKSSDIWQYGIIAVGGVAAVVLGLSARSISSSKVETPAEAPVEAPSDAVTVTGTAQGINGDVTVEVTLTKDTIYSVKVTEQQETEGIGDKAIAAVPDEIVSANSTQVDAVSGATVTSNAIIEAVKNAITAAGFDPAAFDVAVEKEAVQGEDQELTADVVVIGAGGAGMISAMEAADAGKSVIVVESQAMAGGNSVRATGGMNAAKTEYQDSNEFGEDAGIEKTLKSAEESYSDNETIAALAATVREQYEAYKANPEGYFDSVELFELDTLVGGKGINDPELVKTLCEDSEDAIDWLDQNGVTLHNVAQFGGASVKRIHRPVDDEGKTLSVGSYMIPILEKDLEDRGVQILYSTTAEKILMEDGAAAGIEATAKDGSKVTVHAKAVVIAAGGFGANNDMVSKYNESLKGYISTNAPGIQGQGIIMGEEVGAATVDMDQIQLHPTVHVAEDGSANLITEGLRGDGAILVNKEGKRFFDEVSTRDKVSAAENEQTDGVVWLIVDQKMYDNSKVIQGYDSKGWMVSGSSAEELAEKMGVDAAALSETISKWNECVANKSDEEFGRTSFAEPLEDTLYALTVQPGVHHTMGGLKINAETEVLTEDGTAIPGLYAAGEVTGGVHGANRLGGNAVADFTVFGRIAGQQAAAYVDGGSADTAAETTAAESSKAAA